MPLALAPVYQVCKDHTVSGENFELVYDEEKDMLVTGIFYLRQKGAGGKSTG